jgi:hypothetical protein
MPIQRQINNIKLPDSCTIYKDTKVKFSDVNWEHISGEKVIICDGGCEYVKQYVEEHNSENQLKNIDICEYSGMSSDWIYNSDYDDTYLSLSDEEKQKYVKIYYFKEVIGTLWYYADIYLP